MKLLISFAVLCSNVFSSSDGEYVSVTYGFTNDDCDQWSSVNKTKFAFNCMKLEDLPSIDDSNSGCFSSFILGHGKMSGSLKGHHWTSELNQAVGKSSSAVACQAHCQRTKDCAQFMWNKKTNRCSLRTFRETAASLSTRVDDVVIPSSSKPALSDPRWAACDMALLNDCSTGDRQCVSCENHPRCLVSAPNVVSGPKYCSKYSPFDWCRLLPKTEPVEAFFVEGGPTGRCADTSGFDVLFLQEATEQSVYLSEFLSLTSSTLKPLLDASPMGAESQTLMLGHALFRDKPVEPFGTSEDFCFRISQPLTTDSDAFATAIESVKASGGGDNPSDQFGALVASASSSSVGWREDSSRVIVLITNSVSHFSTRDSKTMFEISPRGTDYEDANEEEFCRNSDYSNARDLRVALKMKANHDVVFLTTFGAEFDYWKWVNQFIGQPDDFVQVLEEDGSNMVAALSAGLAAVLKNCDRDLVNHESA